MKENTKNWIRLILGAIVALGSISQFMDACGMVEKGLNDLKSKPSKEA